MTIMKEIDQEALREQGVGQAEIDALVEMQRMMEETLDPALEEYLHDGLAGKSLRHPLVYQVPFYNPGMANRQLEYKRKRLQEALDERDWYTYIYLHERPYRLMALIMIEHRLNNEQFWSLAGGIWTDSENIHQYEDQWLRIFADDRSYRQCFMSKKSDRKALKALPDWIDVYRGAREGVNEDGFSWTTSKDRAVWFSKRYAPQEDAGCVVMHGRVNKADVVAFLTSRGEDEIVVADPAAVEITSIEEIEQ